MTVSDIEKRVALIDVAKSDPEKAHSAQDDLWLEVLQHISQYPLAYGHAAQIAQAALKTEEIDFPRWCA